MPESIEEVVWYLLCGAVSLLLWGIKQELKAMREDLRVERNGREALAVSVARIEARCKAQHG